MTKLSAFCKTHRLGMFYGFLWFFAVTFAFASLGPAKFIAKPDYNFMATTLAACLITGVIVTAVMRKRFKGNKSFLWYAFLSQALGAFLLGVFMSMIMLGASIWSLLYANMHGVAGKPIGLAMLAEYLVMGPFFVFFSFISIFSPLFIALSLLNTWHFRKVINRQTDHSDLQSGIA
jgi:hypothetical protein